MKFKFTADIIFDAVNLDCACRLLEEHFHNLSNTEQETDNNVWFIGEMKIEPINK